jgi:uncharacterized protein with GYD domain
MPQYMTLMKMTPTGRREIAASLDRGDVVNAALAEIGVARLDYFITLGRYDCVMIFDAPDEAAMGHALMFIGTLGAVETETMPIVSKEDYGRILATLAQRPEP